MNAPASRATDRERLHELARRVERLVPSHRRPERFRGARLPKLG